jgi:hypothetical protein
MVAVEQDKSALVDLDLTLVGAYVSAWNVLDLEGNAVPLDAPQNAPDDVIQAIALACLELWKTAQLRNAGPGRSQSTLRAVGSE